MNNSLKFVQYKYKLIVLSCCILVSCNSSKKIAYLQDANDATTQQIEDNQGIVIQPQDVLSIVVSSKNPELAMTFNLPLHSYQAGSVTSASSYTQRLLGYLVDMEGNIDFPVFGKIQVAGLTRFQLSETIKQRLIRENMIKDPIVITNFMNFRISVLGEVKTPGIFNIEENDKITIFEALSKAGDLTIYGKRDVVLVRREVGDTVIFHRVDLRSKNVLHSPVYYLQQNDVVYVEPNKAMAGRAKINENRSMNLWISMASLIVSLAVLFK
jgi:polysaccharide export outer membrane protein